MSNENTNWGQSITGVVIKGNRVLLARHTYGGGKGKLIIPGGFVNMGETPQDALVREFMEETQIWRTDTRNPYRQLLGIAHIV